LLKVSLHQTLDEESSKMPFPPSTALVEYRLQNLQATICKMLFPPRLADLVWNFKTPCRTLPPMDVKSKYVMVIFRTAFALPLRRIPPLKATLLTSKK
jgi:hypothetical protein